MFTAVAFFRASPNKESSRILNSRQYEFCRKCASLVASMNVGELNHFYGKKHSDETKKKIRDAQLGKSMEERLGSAERAIEFKKKLSAAAKGKNNPMYGYVWKEETKKAIGDANRGEKTVILNKLEI